MAKRNCQSKAIQATKYKIKCFVGATAIDAKWILEKQSKWKQRKICRSFASLWQSATNSNAVKFCHFVDCGIWVFFFCCLLFSIFTITIYNNLKVFVNILCCFTQFRSAPPPARASFQSFCQIIESYLNRFFSAIITASVCQHWIYGFVSLLLLLLLFTRNLFCIRIDDKLCLLCKYFKLKKEAKCDGKKLK